MKDNNTVKIIDNRIYLSTNDQAAEYAFYLYFKESVEKIMYSNNNSAYFNIKKGRGLYRAVFFKKQLDGSRVIESTFFCIINNKIEKVKVSVLEEVQDYKITLYDINSSVSFIVFMETNTTKNTRPFGLDFLLSEGYNVIACNQNSDQYQGLSFEDFERIVSPVILHKKAFLYGSSLGGYCAVYYAGAINGTVIAGAPRNSAHPMMIDLFGGRGYLEHDFKHKNIIENKKTENNIYILLDPYQDRDVFFINNFIVPAYGDKVKLIQFPYAGHEVLHHVNRTKQLSSIINNIVLDKGKSISINEVIDSEFSLCAKGDYYYKNLENIVNKYCRLDNRHPTAEAKMIKLLKNIKKLSNIEL